MFSVETSPRHPKPRSRLLPWVELKTQKESKRQKMLWRIGPNEDSCQLHTYWEKRLWGERFIHGG